MASWQLVRGVSSGAWLAALVLPALARHPGSPGASPTDDRMTVTNPWLLLFVAGLLEIGWAVGLKYTDGFSRTLPTFLTVAALIASFVLLARALREIPVGTGYAVWTGIGAVGTAILGIVLFHEPRDAVRLACIGLIVAGIAGLRLTATG